VDVPDKQHGKIGLITGGVGDIGFACAGHANYLIPFFGVLIAAIVLHERLTTFMVAGGVLVLASTLLISVYEERQRGLAPSVNP
jgi:drug/metabolite transporter (DMT)-like permease